ncbi:MAG: rod shape-determining protein RodA [Cyclobacteriaceae bacterium]|nr:rod shape-determining protein RodA [Cyclobacteriaceae bacterium HetDA_MAG_MS6]
MRNEQLSSRIDWFTILLYLFMVFGGWLSIYAADYDPDTSASIFQLSQNSGKQLLWIGTSGILALIVISLDSKFFPSFAYVIYGFFIILLIGVLFFGKEIAGSKSWFAIGSFRLQPSEFAKFATVLAMARLFETSLKLTHLRDLLKAVAVFAVPAGLIILQGDMGSALVYVSLVLVLFREGMSPILMVSAIVIGLLFIMTLLVNQTVLIVGIVVIGLVLIGLIARSITKGAIVAAGVILALGIVKSVDFVMTDVLKPHQQKRILFLVNPNIDPLGIGWNVTQSKIAIGSGGLTGKGFLNGTQTKFDFVPEQSTDFIFCTIGEEHGWLGSLVLLVAFAVFLLRILTIAERQKSTFARVYGYGVASIFFFHIGVNIAMTIGLFPVIGIPLPFFSYGGSSLWAFTILLFILLKLDAHRMQILVRR